jgi:hypothetical protein
MRINLEYAGEARKGEGCHVRGCYERATTNAALTDMDTPQNLPPGQPWSPILYVVLCSQHMFDLRNFGRVEIEMDDPIPPNRLREPWLVIQEKPEQEDGGSPATA